MKRVFSYLLLPLVTVVALTVVHHYAPLQPAVVSVYVGLGLLLAGLVSTLKPLGLLGIRRRATALLILAIGVAFTLGGLEWPVSSRIATGPHQRLDDFMPSYEFYERHVTYAHAPAFGVSDAVQSVTFGDVPVATWLLRIRAMAQVHFETREARPQPILESSPHRGTSFLLPLDPSGAAELVYGMVGRPWTAWTAPTEDPRSRVVTPADWLRHCLLLSRPTGGRHHAGATPSRVAASAAGMGGRTCGHAADDRAPGLAECGPQPWR